MARCQNRSRFGIEHHDIGIFSDVQTAGFMVDFETLRIAKCCHVVKLMNCGLVPDQHLQFVGFGHCREHGKTGAAANIRCHAYSNIVFAQLLQWHNAGAQE